MKLFPAFVAVSAAQQVGQPVNTIPAGPAMPQMPPMNPLMLSLLFGKDSLSDNKMLMMMMMGGNMGSMNPLMLSMLFDDDDDEIKPFADYKKICDAQTAKALDCVTSLAVIYPDSINQVDCSVAPGGSAVCDKAVADASKAILDMDESDSSGFSDILLYSMMSGQGGMGQSMLPYLLLKDNKSSNKDLLLLMMMSGGNLGGPIGGGMGGINPMLLSALM